MKKITLFMIRMVLLGFLLRIFLDLAKIAISEYSEYYSLLIFVFLMGLVALEIGRVIWQERKKTTHDGFFVQIGMLLAAEFTIIAAAVYAW